MIVLSCGGGVQSSTVALMAEAGELPKPDVAFFSDTMWEPAPVYKQLDYLESCLSFPLIRVSQGDLGAHILSGVRGEITSVKQAPFFVINRAGSLEHSAPDRGGMLWRKCTQDYKLAPLRRAVRKWMRENGAKRVDQWIGISLDEAHRMKPSGVKHITNVYPLVDLRMTRNDCLQWLERHGHPRPPKSACIFCPYHSDAFWRDMKRNDTGSWTAAVQFDADLRGGKLPGVTGDAYVHRSMRPLSEVDFSNAEDRGQINMFGNECEGMCGV